MKTSIQWAIGLVLVAPALAQEGKPAKVLGKAQKAAGQATQQASDAMGDAAGSVGESLSKGIDALQEQVLGGNVTPAAFDGMKAQIRQLGQGMAKANPNAAELGQRLERRVADLQERATQGNATAEDFAILREQVADTRLDNALSKLAARAGEAKPDREELGRIAKLLKARADAAAKLDPEAAAEGQKVMRTFSGLQKKAGETGLEPADFSGLRSQLAEVRLDRALSDLQSRAISKTASPADYARVNDVLADRTAVIGTPEAQALQERLANAIEKLKAKAAAGGVTPEEFKAVRDNLIKKARMASEAATQGAAGQKDQQE